MAQTSADTNLDHLYPPFRERFVASIAEAQLFLDKRFPGYKFKIGEGFRTASYQHQLWLEGRNAEGHIVHPDEVVTERDGTSRESNHQSSCAGDTWLFNPAGKVVWEGSAIAIAFAYLGHCYREHGLKWGGDWMRLRDLPHGELDESDIAAYKLARAWQVANGLRAA